MTGCPPAWLPDVHFGHVGAPLPTPGAYDSADPDDELLPETPPEICLMLGFDPAHEDEGAA